MVIVIVVFVIVVLVFVIVIVIVVVVWSLSLSFLHALFIHGVLACLSFVVSCSFFDAVLCFVCGCFGSCFAISSAMICSIVLAHPELSQGLPYQHKGAQKQDQNNSKSDSKMKKEGKGLCKITLDILFPCAAPEYQMALPHFTAN